MAFALAVFFWIVGTLTVGLFLGRVWWLPQLISDHGGLIDRQFAITLTIAGLVFLLAQIGLGLFIWRYSGRRPGRATYWHENPRLEMSWTVLTAILFIGLAIEGNRVWANYFVADAPPSALTIEVTAQQFAWNVRYPGRDGKFGRTSPSLVDDSSGNYIGLDPKDPAGQDDITTQNIVAVPVNRPVRVILRSKDVTHSFFVPMMRVKQDAVPGMGIPIHFTANRTGEFEIACAELCGMQHYKMRGRLLVMEPANFEKWLKARESTQ